MAKPVSADGLPFNGIRVISITGVWAGTFTSELLADWGCEVIRVESTQRWQIQTRGNLVRPTKEIAMQGTPWFWGYPDWDPGERPWNRFPWFNSHARNKLGMTVDLTKPKGMDILRRLVKQSDLFIENNPPGTMDKLGITYQWLMEARPDIIMIRMPGFGLSGPYKDYRAFGSGLEDTAAFTSLRGYTGLDPMSIATTPVFQCDASVGACGALAAAIALRHRRRTGRGQLIEAAQIEALIPQMGEAVMDYTMNRRVQRSIGNRDIHGAAPSGNYRCRGEDRWVSITVRNDHEWQGFCRALGNPEWTEDEKFATTLSRYKNQDELDEMVEAWTIEHDHYAIMYSLQNEGVAAAPITDAADAYADPHFKNSGVFEELTHPEAGTHTYVGLGWRLARTSNHIRRYACRLGEDNGYVYRELLGLSDEEYAEMEREGHIGTDYAPHVGP